ncbi:MAG: tripartite tricarboxylate transporter substrate-binding protein [Beijerinckiaceae bacterium]|nr:tripartite tricarboxylate transporter substrate-binding protein [Beijerinckiaceae bacterium]
MNARRLCFPVVVSFAALGSFASSQAQSPGDFYKGKQIDIIVGSLAGGGYDQYARVLARYMPAHIPGNPQMVVKNSPGGGGRTAMNQVYNVSAKDGTVIGITTRNVTWDPLYGEQVTFDPTKLSWLGSLNSDTSLCVVWHTTPHKTLEAMKENEVLMGSGGPTISDSVHVKVLNQIAKTKLKLVLGYKGSTDVHLAMERGEVQGRCGLTWGSIQARYGHWMAEKKISLVAQFALNKNPDLPDVPFIMDLAQTPEQKQMIELLLAANEMGRPFFLPPGVPKDRIQALQNAFVATAKDPKFIAEADKQGMELQLMTGDEVERLVARVYASPKAIVEMAKEIVASK